METTSAPWGTYAQESNIAQARLTSEIRVWGETAELGTMDSGGDEPICFACVRCSARARFFVALFVFVWGGPPNLFFGIVLTFVVPVPGRPK